MIISSQKDLSFIALAYLLLNAKKQAALERPQRHMIRTWIQSLKRAKVDAGLLIILIIIITVRPLDQPIAVAAIQAISVIFGKKNKSHI